MVAVAALMETLALAVALARGWLIVSCSRPSQLASRLPVASSCLCSRVSRVRPPRLPPPPPQQPSPLTHPWPRGPWGRALPGSLEVPAPDPARTRSPSPTPSHCATSTLTCRWQPSSRRWADRGVQGDPAPSGHRPTEGRELVLMDQWEEGLPTAGLACRPRPQHQLPITPTSSSSACREPCRGPRDQGEWPPSAER